MKNSDMAAAIIKMGFPEHYLKVAIRDHFQSERRISKDREECIELILIHMEKDSTKTLLSVSHLQ